MHQGNRRAAWVLILLAPVVAELGLGVTRPTLAFLVLLWLPIYGAGILLVRETARRAGRGWPSIVVLGLAYELVEDGIGLQALTSPHIYGAAEWGPRVLGLNLPYWEANAIYHILFSAVIPIVLTDLLFPAHRDRPYLKKGGLAVTAAVWVVGVAILRVTVPPTMDPGYDAPIPVLVGVVVAVAALAFLALRVLPPRQPDTVDARAVPPPWTLWPVGALGTALLLFLSFPLHGSGTAGPAFTGGRYTLIPMAAALLVALAGYVLVRRWSGASSWTDRHSLALVGGALPAHTAMGVLVFRPMLNRFDVVALAAMAVASVILALVLDAKLRRRTVPAVDAALR